MQGRNSEGIALSQPRCHVSVISLLLSIAYRCSTLALPSAKSCCHTKVPRTFKAIVPFSCKIQANDDWCQQWVTSLQALLDLSCGFSAAAGFLQPIVEPYLSQGNRSANVQVFFGEAAEVAGENAFPSDFSTVKGRKLGSRGFAFCIGTTQH